MVKPVEFAEYFAPTPIPFWTTLQQVGVTRVISELDRSPDGMHDDTGDRPWDLTPLARMQRLYADAGLELVGIEDYPPMDRARTGADLPDPVPRYARGYGRLYVEHVMQADAGCDFDFLRARPGEAAESEPLGLVGGPIGGW